MLKEMLDNNIQILVVGIVFTFGAGISTTIWAYKNKVISIWMILSSFACSDPKFLRRLFIDGPGFPIIIVWLSIAGICGFILAPALLNH